MKKMLVAVAVLTVSFGAFAHGHHGGFHHGWGGPHHHHSYWGRGGCHFWPGFVGGMVGGAVYSAAAYPYYSRTVVVQPATTVVTPAVVAAPTVVAQPVVAAPAAVAPVAAAPVAQTQNVWVEGRYVDQVQANGSVVRVWQPGHYEQQTVIAQ